MYGLTMPFLIVGAHSLDIISENEKNLSFYCH